MHRKYTARSRRSSVFRPTAARSHTDTALSRRPPFFQAAVRQRRIYMCSACRFASALSAAVRPRHRHAVAVGQRIANLIIRDALPVVGHHQVFPTCLRIPVLNRSRRRYHSKA